jgi:hypothetical protein
MDREIIVDLYEFYGDTVNAKYGREKLSALQLVVHSAQAIVNGDNSFTYRPDKQSALHLFMNHVVYHVKKLMIENNVLRVQLIAFNLTKDSITIRITALKKVSDGKSTSD